MAARPVASASPTSDSWPQKFFLVDGLVWRRILCGERASVGAEANRGIAPWSGSPTGGCSRCWRRAVPDVVITAAGLHRPGFSPSAKKRRAVIRCRFCQAQARTRQAPAAHSRGRRPLPGQRHQARPVQAAAGLHSRIRGKPQGSRLRSPWPAPVQDGVIMPTCGLFSGSEPVNMSAPARGPRPGACPAHCLRGQTEHPGPAWPFALGSAGGDAALAVIEPPLAFPRARCLRPLQPESDRISWLEEGSGPICQAPLP